MKKTLVLALACLLTTGLQAKSPSKKKTKLKKNSTTTSKLSSKKSLGVRERSIDISLGYISNTLKEKDEEEVDGKGISLRAGKMFNFSNGITTTTSVIGNFVSHDKNDMDIDSGYANTYDLGLSQRLSYDFGMSGPILRPFIEVGVSRGKFDYHDTSNISGSSEDYNAEVNYLKYGGSLGFQLAFSNGITPFAKFNIAKMRYDKTAEFSGTNNGQPFSGTYTFDDSEERNVDTKSLTIGLGYLF